MKRDREAARKANLAAMGAGPAAKQEIKVGPGNSWSEHFRRVRIETENLSPGIRGSCLRRPVHSVEIGIVHAADMEGLHPAPIMCSC